MIVLNYHHVHDEDENFFRVTTKQFERQMQYILDCGYTFVTLDQFLERPDAPASVLVTFDDGYEDVYYNAAPILERLKIPAVMFLIAGYIGKWNDWDAHVAPSRRRHMDETRIRECIAAGCSVGSHSMSHVDLRTVAPDGLLVEVSDSQKRLQDLFQVPVASFAFPGGHFNDHVERETSRHYRAAFGTEEATSTSVIPRLEPVARNFRARLDYRGSWGFLASCG